MNTEHKAEPAKRVNLAPLFPHLDAGYFFNENTDDELFITLNEMTRDQALTKAEELEAAAREAATHAAELRAFAALRWPASNGE
jgi:hypothetical protein